MDTAVDAASLGRLLGEAKLDVKRLGLDMLLRIVISALAVWIWNADGPVGHLGLILYTGLVVLVLYPLIHVKDRMEFYENGVSFKKNTYLFRSNQAVWSKSEGIGHLLAGRYLSLGGYPKCINASYLEAPQETFEQVYRDILA